MEEARTEKQEKRAIIEDWPELSEFKDVFLKRTWALTTNGIWKCLRGHFIQVIHDEIQTKLRFFNELGKLGNSKDGLDTNRTRNNFMYFTKNRRLYKLPANHSDRGFLAQQLKVRVVILSRKCTFRLNFESPRVAITTDEAADRAQKMLRWYRC